MLDSPSGPIAQRVMSTVIRIADAHDVSRDINLSEHLVDRGMTSMAMVDLMLAIEAEFDMTIPQREMTPENFQSAASLAEMVDRLCLPRFDGVSGDATSQGLR